MELSSKFPVIQIFLSLFIFLSNLYTITGLIRQEEGGRVGSVGASVTVRSSACAQAGTHVAADVENAGTHVCVYASMSQEATFSTTKCFLPFKSMCSENYLPFII